MAEVQSARLVILTAGGLNPQVMINALHEDYPNLVVIQERYESKAEVLRRRARRLGWITALGQLGTMIVSRLGKRMAQRRTEEILKEYRLTGEPSATIPVIEVDSLNSGAGREAIARCKPDIVLAISCRLLSRKTLDAISCPIVNFHAGINPAYRGQMGGYWARVEGDEANFGATLHYVDAGTDTGDSLAEVRVKPKPGDTISTYPLLLTAAAVDTTRSTLKAVLSGHACPYQPQGQSTLRFPPPLWTYLLNGFSKNIW